MLVLADLFSFDVDLSFSLSFFFSCNWCVVLAISMLTCPTQTVTAHPHMPIASSYGHLDSSGMHPAAVLR
jgi:hypothetical protein